MAEKYKLLYNKKTVKNKEKWNKLKPYIDKYDISVVPHDKYFIGTLEQRINKLDNLANNTVNVYLEYVGLEHLLNQKLETKPTKEEIVKKPNDYLKSFILVVMDDYYTTLEVIPNGNDKSAPGGAIARYFLDFE